MDRRWASVTPNAETVCGDTKQAVNDAARILRDVLDFILCFLFGEDKHKSLRLTTSFLWILQLILALESYELME
ncbi:hypothetical protein CF68_22495 [Cupriavidus sp. SK-4]|nr:hypothetical protein CF68_22495 [Cupriavidus sp. SK-4]